jgi:small conductance mechanosensitive channel
MEESAQLTFVEQMYLYAAKYGMSVLAAIIIFIVGRWLAKLLSKLVQNAMIKAKINRTLALFGRHVVFYGVMTFVCIAALNKLGVATGSFIAVVGAASLAVGLALQGSLSNFASGVLLILFQPFQVGDVIEAGGAKGRVEEIQIFTTLLLTDDNKRVIIPNAKITSDKIIIDSHQA